MNNNKLLEDQFKIKDVTFENRILRSSLGGRHCTYDGTVTDVWKNFESRFARSGVSGIISTTFHVNQARLSPMQYPSIARDKYKSNLAKYIADIKRARPGLKYIIQIGDPGYATYESLFPDERDALSSYGGFDLAYGYQTWRKRMSEEDIARAIKDYAAAAERVKDVGADGVEIAAAKGYLIHQFLNPYVNRRKDKWGGSPDNRFRFFDEVMSAVRCKVGTSRNFLVGVRLAAADHNSTPVAFALTRWPPVLLAARERRFGNDEDQMIEYAKKLQTRVDYFHIISGFGFPSPRETPGDFPYDEVKRFFHSTHMLTTKTRVRSGLFMLPKFVLRPLLRLGWRYQPALNCAAAERFKREVQDSKIIVNGGFRERATVERALESSDMVSMARALLANPNLQHVLSDGHDVPVGCSGCNKCVGRTGTSPLGCYDESRFKDVNKMYEEILEWNKPDRFDDVLVPARAGVERRDEDAPPRQDVNVLSTGSLAAMPSGAPPHG